MAEKTVAKVAEEQAMLSVNTGLVERQIIKMNVAFNNMPIIKQVIQFKKFASGLKQSALKLSGNKEALKASTDAHGNNQTIMTGAIAGLIAFTKSTEKLTLITGFLNKNFVMIASSMLFFFGIIALVLIGVLALTAVFADVDSPLVQWIEQSKILSSLLNGLRIILTGEDGESGLKGAVEVLTVAIAVGLIAAMLTMSVTVGFVVFAIVTVIGIFAWAKGKTGSTIGGIIAAVAVGSALLLVYLMATAGSISAAFVVISSSVLLPIALIAAGVTGIWLFITGEVNFWWGVLSAILIGIGAALLYGIMAGTAVLFFPIAIIVAVVVLIIALVIKYRDKIGGILQGALDGLMAGYNWLDDWFDGIRADLITVLTAVVMVITWPIRTLIKFWIGVGSTILKAKKWLFDTIASAVAKFIATPGNLKTKLIAAFVDVGISLYRKLKDIFSFTIPGLTIAGKTLWDDFEVDLLPDIPMLAKGGIVNKPTLAMIGESGPEAVVPLGEGGGMGGSTFNINVDVSGITATSDHAKRELADEISRRIMADISDKIGSPTYGRF